MDKKVPAGMYCYSFTGKMATNYLSEYEKGGLLEASPCLFPELKPCPYYTKKAEAGYCSFLATAIDDQMKECKINEKTTKTSNED